MKLTDEQLQLALLKITEKSPKCPVCGGHNLGYANDGYMLFAPAKKEGNNYELLNSETQMFPVFPMTCNACGYVLMFNTLKVLG